MSDGPTGTMTAAERNRRRDGDGAELAWHRVLATEELPEGRVTTVSAGAKSVALVHYDGQFSALDNHCPHQGGPLGEGSIENGLLRCPWHGFDYCPLTGQSPGFEDEATTYPLEIRDGEVFVGIEEQREHVETVTDVIARDARQLGRPARLRDGRPLQPRPGGRDPPPLRGGRDGLHRDPPRGRGRVRRERLRQAHRQARRLPDDRRARGNQPAHRPLGREGRPRARARPDRAGRVAGARPGRLPGGRPRRRVRRGRRLEPDRAPFEQACRAGEPRVQERDRAPRRRSPDLPRRRADDRGAARRSPRGRRAGSHPTRSPRRQPTSTAPSSSWPARSGR